MTPQHICQTLTNLEAGNCSRSHKSKPKQKGNRDVDQLSHVDYATTNTHSSQSEYQLYIFEGNEAVIKMIIKRRYPTMRHVSRTHRVALDGLFDRINLKPNPNQTCWHQKPTCWHANQREFHAWQVESSSIVQHHGILDVLLQPFQQFYFWSDRKA